MNLDELIKKIEEDIFRGIITTNFAAAAWTTEKLKLKMNKELLKEKKEQRITKLKEELKK